MRFCHLITFIHVMEDESKKDGKVTKPIKVLKISSKLLCIFNCYKYAKLQGLNGYQSFYPLTAASYWLHTFYTLSSILGLKQTHQILKF